MNSDIYRQMYTSFFHEHFAFLQTHIQYVYYTIRFGNLLSLRIFTGKKHRQIKLQRLEKVGIWAFGLLVY